MLALRSKFQTKWLRNYPDVRKLVHNIDSTHMTKNIIYNCEHIVPQSIFKEIRKEASSDMHNIILYPSLLNCHRSNYKITDINTNDMFLDKNTRLLGIDGQNNMSFTAPEDLDCIITSLKNTKNCIFVPQKKFRGMFARSVGYFILTYPEFKDLIVDDVMEIGTILTWHHRYPVQPWEAERSMQIYEKQGNVNPFIHFPQLLAPFIQAEYNVPTDFFKDFAYKTHFFNACDTDKLEDFMIVLKLEEFSKKKPRP